MFSLVRRTKVVHSSSACSPLSSLPSSTSWVKSCSSVPPAPKPPFQQSVSEESSSFDGTLLTTFWWHSFNNLPNRIVNNSTRIRGITWFSSCKTVPTTQGKFSQTHSYIIARATGWLRRGTMPVSLGLFSSSFLSAIHPSGQEINTSL